MPPISTAWRRLLWTISSAIRAEPWLDYIVGVARELALLERPLHGVEMMILGDVPVACGLSSSASLEMAAPLPLLEQLGGFTLEGPEAPRLGQRVENDFLGLSTGIMDQFISRMGKVGHVLFLDCRSFEYELVPASFDSACFAVANTGVARGLTVSKYNERVAQCREAVEGMRRTLGKTGSHLRDFTREDLEAARASLLRHRVPARPACHHRKHANPRGL
ncbi:MAG: galactokinase [Candidatus Hydrogenedentales bacterium]